ncbi:MAG: ATP synthase F1 subunit gamma [Planctomycetes bacterium]|nr:ATP synthase F1 subunit gamma [Planctomycetota bacterium]
MQTQDIKRRIRSVKNTQQITRAMKFVAAAKLRRAQDSMLAMRPYADAIDGLIRHIAEDLVGDEHPLLTVREPAKRVAIVLIAGDRGLAGGFNNNIFRAVSAYVDGRPEIEPVFFAVGKRTIAYLRKTSREIVVTYHDVFEKLSYVMAGEICEKLVRMFVDESDKRIDEAYVVYNEFASMLTQRPVSRRLLPISVKEMMPKLDLTPVTEPDKDDAVLEEIVLEEAPDDIFDYADMDEELMEERGELAAQEEKPPPRPIYELLPDTNSALEKLMSRRMATEIYRAMLESYAAELAARMTAMDNATANADEMVSGLTLDLNRARQTSITMELLDIVGGANALG